MSKLWVLVADASQAILYARNGYKLLEQVGETFEPEGTPIDKAMGKPGRMREAAPISGHVYGHKSDLREHEKRVFAREIARKLKDCCDQFDELIVIAAPLVLGELRKNLDTNVQSKVAREVDKDMTKIQPAQIADFLFSLPAG
ncbi:MAG: host attachment protein [Pseudomonadota bacterium]